MPARKPKHVLSEETPPPISVTVAGVRYDLGEPTARDYLILRQINQRKGPDGKTKLTDEDVDALVGLFSRRIVGSSVEDPLDRPVRELMIVLSKWQTGKEDAALPPPTATSSSAP